jgi:hypothetical protein
MKISPIKDYQMSVENISVQHRHSHAFNSTQKLTARLKIEMNGHREA